LKADVLEFGRRLMLAIIKNMRGVGHRCTSGVMLLLIAVSFCHLALALLLRPMPTEVFKRWMKKPNIETALIRRTTIVKGKPDLLLRNYAGVRCRGWNC